MRQSLFVLIFSFLYLNSLAGHKASNFTISEGSNKTDTLFFSCKCGQLLIEIQSDTAIVIEKNCSNESVILKRIRSLDDEIDAFIEDSKIFKFENEYFFKAQITERGTAYINRDILYHINKEECSIEEVNIDYSISYYQKYLKAHEGIWKGESRIYSDDTIKGGFYIWNGTDANCCPTAGEVSVFYRIKRMNGGYLMQPDTNSFILTR